MKTYNDYQISKTFQTVSSGVYAAFKINAVTINGISFNHHFYFQYRDESPYTVNGKPCKPFDEWFIALVNGGSIQTTDLKQFTFKPEFGEEQCSISVDELGKYHNVEVED
jgi:hypothetical protein